MYNRDPDTVTNEAYNVVKQTSGTANESEYETIPPPTSPTTQSTAGDYEQV